jgi:hypothetical protein
VFDGDPQARVKDRDRDRAVYVIDAALRSGQITQQDRDLRLERARSAATVGELDGLVRDIAAPPAPVPPTAVVPPVAAPATTGAATGTTGGGSPYAPGSQRPTAPVPSDLYGPHRSAKARGLGGTTTKTSSAAGRKVALGCGLIVALFFVVPIAIAVIIFAASSNSGTDLVDPDPVPAGPPFVLTAAGLREYVATFEESFDDTEVVRSVFYDGYVVSWVPQDHGKVAIWNYVNGAFDQLGDPMEDVTDTAPVDLADLRPGKVMSLVRVAQETLGVEEPATTYVIFDRNLIDDDPGISVYVTNEDGQSGYLLGDLDGNVTSTQGAQ